MHTQHSNDLKRVTRATGKIRRRAQAGGTIEPARGQHGIVVATQAIREDPELAVDGSVLWLPSPTRTRKVLRLSAGGGRHSCGGDDQRASCRPDLLRIEDEKVGNESTPWTATET